MTLWMSEVSESCTILLSKIESLEQSGGVESPAYLEELWLRRKKAEKAKVADVDQGWRFMILGRVPKFQLTKTSKALEYSHTLEMC